MSDDYWTAEDEAEFGEGPAEDPRFTSVEDANRCQCEADNRAPCQNAMTGEDMRCPTCRGGNCRVFKRSGYPAIHTRKEGGLKPAGERRTSRERKQTQAALERDRTDRSWDAAGLFTGNQPSGVESFPVDEDGIELAWEHPDA